MDKTILQSLLDAQVFTLPDNDDRLVQLEKSVEQLAEKLTKELNKLPYYTLVALDSKISSTEPIIVEVEEIIKTNWTTFRNGRPETPISIIRSVIIAALNKLGKENSKCAQIIYLTASNFYPYAVLTGERDIVEQVILTIGEIAEKYANEEWSLVDESPVLKLSTLKLSPFKINNVEVKSDTITNSFSSFQIGATTVYNNSDVALASNVNTALGSLKTKLPTAITNMVNTVASSISEGLDTKDFESSINKFFADFKKSLDKELKSSFSAMQSVEQRSRLLWWKETLYSTHLKKSYRETNKEIRPIVMAYDLFQQLPEITPISVDYLLKDTLYLLNDKVDESIKFSDILPAIENSDKKSELEGCFYKTTREGRVSITDFIYLLSEGKVKSKDLLKYTGIDPKKTVTPCELSVMILHDLQSNWIAK